MDKNGEVSVVTGAAGSVAASPASSSVTHYTSRYQGDGNENNNDDDEDCQGKKRKKYWYKKTLYQADGTPRYFGGRIYRPTQAAVNMTSR